MISKNNDFPHELTESEALEIIKQLSSLKLTDNKNLKLHSSQSLGNSENDIEMMDQNASSSDTSTAIENPIINDIGIMKVFFSRTSKKDEEEEKNEEQRRFYEKKCIDILLQSDKFAQKALLEQYINFVKRKAEWGNAMKN